MSLAMQAAKYGRPLRVRGQMGDPGFWSYLKDKVLSGTKFGIDVVTGGGGSAIASALGGGGGGVVVPPGGGPPLPTGVRKPGVRGAAERFVPGGQTGLGTGCPKGFRPNKTSYYLKGGEFVEAGTKCVRYRRKYNPANAEATSDAIGRINASKRMQGKLAEISTGKYTASGKRKPHAHR